jgi:hypothetical protein
MKDASLPILLVNPPRQLSMALDSVELRGLTPIERKTAVSRLARLLMEAVGVALEEHRDDEH